MMATTSNNNNNNAAAAATTTLNNYNNNESSAFMQRKQQPGDNDSQQSDGDGTHTSSVGVRETRTLRQFRATLTFFLLICGVALGIGVFFLVRSQEQAELADSFDDSTNRLIDQVHSSIERKIGTLESFSISLTSYVNFKKSNNNNKNNNNNNDTNNDFSWPFVTIPDFEFQAASARALSQAVSIELCPLVTGENRKAWESYARENLNNWTTAGLEFEELIISTTSAGARGRRRKLEDDDIGGIVADEISYYAPGERDDNTDNLVPVPPTDYYFPVWQSSPVSTALVNLDLHSTNLFSKDIDLLVETGQVVVGTTVDPSTANDPVIQAFKNSFEARSNSNTIGYFESGGPVGFLYVPVFDVLLTKNSMEDRRPVAFLTALLNWESYLFQALPPNTPEIRVVVTNACGEAFTYSILGEFVEYVGIGDLHDRKYDPFKIDTTAFEFESSSSSSLQKDGGSRGINDSCQYHMEIYPTQAYEDRYLTTRPWIFFAIGLAVFFLLIALIYFYDRRVERNYKLVYRRAKQAGAIVSSIFPAAVRQRLYRDEEETRDVSTRTGGNNNNGGGGRSIPTAISANKAKIKGFLKDHPGNVPEENESGVDNTEKEVEGVAKGVAGIGGDCPDFKQQAIADLFPDVTIMFAGVVGFSAWSSQRNPGEVFTFLQDLYFEFDAVARSMGVFKVETIGDCYVAATGLPERQPDHAARMAKFAAMCMQAMMQVTRSLEVRLGPDTGELQLRVGLHSGPVTAGVLRGAKARFQLFGDTMNMAARMEQHSLPGKIQCSNSTAELLQNAGKDHWVHSREEKVWLKGKGEVDAFWVVQAPKPSDAPSAASTNYDLLDRASLDPNDETGGADSSSRTTPIEQQKNEQFWIEQGSTRNNRFHRLIDWNVELLSDLLRQIEARRRNVKRKSTKVKKGHDTPSIRLKGGSTALDEVSEIVHLPQNSNDKMQTKTITSKDDVELSVEVLLQLREYVTTIATMYRQNYFHNFEHASHVTMSTIKLLRRVADREGILEENLNDEQHTVNPNDLHDYTFGITSDPLTQFTLVFCALIHDVDHPGVSNYQLIQEKVTIAKLYKNKSVAEQNSIDLAWDLLMDPTYDDLRKAIYVDDDELKRFRQLLVNIVLATDIFDKDMKSMRDRRWGRAFQYSNGDDDVDDEEKTEDLPKKALERNYDTPIPLVESSNLRATIVMEHLIQASDVSHTMQHFEIYLKWNERLFNEMYSAYKCGRAPKDPSKTWYEGEIMFFDKYVIPLAKKLADCRVFGVSSDECLNYATQNRKHWAIRGDDIVKEFVERYENGGVTAPPNELQSLTTPPVELKLVPTRPL